MHVNTEHASSMHAIFLKFNSYTFLKLVVFGKNKINKPNLQTDKATELIITQ